MVFCAGDDHNVKDWGSIYLVELYGLWFYCSAHRTTKSWQYVTTCMRNIGRAAPRISRTDPTKTSCKHLLLQSAITVAASPEGGWASRRWSPHPKLRLTLNLRWPSVIYRGRTYAITVGLPKIEEERRKSRCDCWWVTKQTSRGHDCEAWLEG